MQTQTQPLKRPKRGRPKKGEETEYQALYFPHCLRFTVNQEALEEKKRKLSTFVLISNTEKADIPDEQLLRAYKGQEAAETRFRLLKDPQLIHGIYLKTPERIEALSTVFVMALLLYGMLETRVRQQMAQEKEPLRFPGRNKTYQPTGKILLEQLQKIKTVVIHEQGRVLRYVSDTMDELPQRIVQMAGYEMSIFTTNHVETLHA